MKQDIRESLKKSATTISEEASSIQKTTFKKEIKNTLQNQSKIAEKINSDLEKTKQAILDTARQSIVQVTLNVKQAMTNTIQSTIKGKSENNK